MKTAAGIIPGAMTLVLMACGGERAPCGEGADAPEVAAAVTRLFTAEDTTSTRFRERHGIDRVSPGWSASRVDEPEECAPVHDALLAWVTAVSGGSREDELQAEDGYSFRIYRAPGHYVVAVELLDAGGGPVGDRTRLVVFRASDLEWVATGLL